MWILSVSERTQGMTYRLEDESGEFTLENFIENNETLDPIVIAAIGSLAIGESYRDGGGAGAEWTIWRIQ